MKMIFVLTLEKATCHIDNYRLHAAIMSRYFCLKIVAMSTKVLGARSLKRQHLKLLCVEHSHGCTVRIYGIVRMKLKNLQMSLIHILLTHPWQFYHVHDSFGKKTLCIEEDWIFITTTKELHSNGFLDFCLAVYLKYCLGGVVHLVTW